jgi:hypothetical protein
MQIYNESARVERNAEFGHVWVEVQSGAGSLSMEVPKYSAVRVKAAATITVQFDGVLSATMTSGEIIIFNSGRGDVGNGTDNKMTVTLAVSGAAYVQIARNTDNGRENIVAPG